MRSKIFLYLFIFTLMFTIFIYVNDKKILDSRDADITRLENKLEQEQAKNLTLLGENKDLLYFSLENNEEAIPILKTGA
jgi:cell division protein FtsL